MNGEMTLKVIAYMQSPFPGKFGIPRQSRRVPEIRSKIIFTPEYRNPDALRGLEGFTHLWILWQFSEAVKDGWSPTVRPPRLGGNQRMGVFATRSPYRPNSIGLSCVKIANIVLSSPDGPYVEVLGADLMDGTPIYDVKPYLPSADCVPEASGGFAESMSEYALTVSDPDNILDSVKKEIAELICSVIAEDPRPGYQSAPDREYIFECAGFRVGFRVMEKNAVLCRCETI